MIASGMNLSLKGLMSIAFAGAFAGCSSPAEDITRQNPNYFSGRVDQETMNISGSYNPLGYDEAEIRTFLALVCADGVLDSYGQMAREDLLLFTASCQGGYVSDARAVEFERIISGTTLLQIPDKIVVEITGTDGAGNLRFDTREFAI